MKNATERHEQRRRTASADRPHADDDRAIDPLAKREVTTAAVRYKAGDRVKLTERAIRSRLANRKGDAQVNWTTRRGVLQRITGNKIYARVIWDGRRSVDEVGLKDIEPAP